MQQWLRIRRQIDTKMHNLEDDGEIKFKLQRRSRMNKFKDDVMNKFEDYRMNKFEQLWRPLEFYFIQFADLTDKEMAPIARRALLK